MEALILIVGELVFALLAPFVIVCVELVGSVLGLTMSFSTGKTATAAIKSRVSRTIGLVLVALAVLLIAVLLVVNSFYFDTAIRHVFSTVEKRAGISTVCRDIDGSLFAGRVNLSDCTLSRPAHAVSTFDLSVAEVSFDLRITSLLSTAKIEVARVAGIDGWVASDRGAAGRKTSKQSIEKPRRRFVIEDLDVADVSIALSGVNPDGNTFELPIEIDHLSSEPLRSRLALFDILFRSNAAGSIAGAPFTIATSSIEEGRETTWRAERVPIASFGAMTGGPLSWFSSGYVDVHVDDQWQRGDALSIDMDWQLEFQDVEVAPPPGTGAFARVAMEPLVRYVNSHDGEFPFAFGMVVNESQFEFKSSLAAAGLWSAVGDSVNAVLATAGISLEGAAETTDALKEGAKSVLDRLRKPKDEESE